MDKKVDNDLLKKPDIERKSIEIERKKPLTCQKQPKIDLDWQKKADNGK